MGYTAEDVRSAKRALVKSYMGTIPPGFVTQAASSDPLHNVVGVGVRSAGELAVRVYVAKKIDSNDVPPKRRLPDSIDGIPVEVVESGRFMAFATDRLRPARPGCSIGCRTTGASRMAGTFGALVTKRGQIFILSNNHVLAGENRLAAGAEIVQPGSLDDDSNGEPIASLSEFISLEKKGSNAMDCAIAAVPNRVLVSPEFLPPIHELAGPEPRGPVENMVVHKVGRSTDFTKGQVFDVEGDVFVEYRRLGVLHLENQVLIRGLKEQFSKTGDSGAVIVDQGSARAVALLCGGSTDRTGLDHVTVANPLAAVLDRLDVKLVTRW